MLAGDADGVVRIRERDRVAAVFGKDDEAAARGEVPRRRLDIDVEFAEDVERGRVQPFTREALALRLSVEEDDVRPLACECESSRAPRRPRPDDSHVGVH